MMSVWAHLWGQKYQTIQIISSSQENEVLKCLQHLLQYFFRYAAF